MIRYNKRHLKQQYYKIVRDDLTHNGFVYQLGLNVDNVPFNPSGSCEPGGLYYTTAEHLAKFFDYGHQIADVEIPADAKTYEDPDETVMNSMSSARVMNSQNSARKWKADRLIITKLTPIAEHKLWWNEKFCLSVVRRDGWALQYVKEQTEEICLAAVKQCVKEHATKIMLKDIWYCIEKKNIEICLSHNEQSTNEQIEEMCEFIIQQDNNVLRYIRDEQLREQIKRRLLLHYKN